MSQQEQTIIGGTIACRRIHILILAAAFCCIFVCASCKKTQPAIYTVTFDANGGTGTMPEQQAQKKQEIKLAPAAFRYPGYKFSHWAKEKTGSETVYEDQASITLTQDIILYAQWIPLDPTLTVNGVPTDTLDAVTLAAQLGDTDTLQIGGKVDAKIMDAIAAYIAGTGEITNLDMSQAFGITELSEGQFEQCTALKKCVLPDGLISIGSSAFSGCSSLTDIVFPDTVEIINEWAFYECKSLKTAELPPQLTALHKSAFSRCETLEQITLPDTLTEIGPWAFSNCEKLQKIDIPARITRISESTFSFCKELQEVHLPPQLTAIEDTAFLYCEKMKTITLPETVTELGENAFYNCASLTEITIPAQTQRIGTTAFFGCKKLRKIHVLAEKPPVLGKNAFEGIPLNTEITVPAGSLDIYRQENVWKDYKRRIVASR